MVKKRQTRDDTQELELLPPPRRPARAVFEFRINRKTYRMSYQRYAMPTSKVSERRATAARK
jgi:hypothetical protein